MKWYTIFNIKDAFDSVSSLSSLIHSVNRRSEKAFLYLIVAIFVASVQPMKTMASGARRYIGMSQLTTNSQSVT